MDWKQLLAYVTGVVDQERTENESCGSRLLAVCG